MPWYHPGIIPTVSFVRLTPREHQAAELAALGLSNGEIAARLGCSVRTVESHLAQARAKLGAVTRHDLAERLAQAAHEVAQAHLTVRGQQKLNAESP